MIDPGTIIDGRYEVLQRVGSGGMADVYLVSDQLLGRRVAVKVLHHRFAEDQEFVERFRREASAAAGLSHPNVVGIFDRGAWDGTYYIAMEYLPGRTLKQVVREHGALTPAVAIDVTIQILRAARFAHRRGVIHRDLKPHNVILDEEGRAKVTDFGIARAGASDMTLTGSIMGTAQYLSPEQAQGHAVSEASDLYAIGVVLYELLTGRVPFEGETAVTIALQHISSEPQPPSALNPLVPPALDAVVLHALAKDPLARPRSADELIAALEQVRATLPEPAGEHALGGVAAQGVPGGGQGDVSPAAGALAAAAGAAAGAATARPGEPQHGPPQHGQPQQHGPQQHGAPQPGPPQHGGSPQPNATQQFGPQGDAPQWPAPVGLIPSYQGNGATTGSLMPVVPGQEGEPNGEGGGGSGIDKRLLLWGAGGVLLALLVGALLALLLPAGTITVPNVTQQPEATAIATLRHAGLKAAPTTGRSTSVIAGNVVTQAPPAGTEVKSGTVVEIVVSTGPGVTTVPEVVNLPEQQALQKLRDVSLKPIVERESSEEVAEGYVIATDPGGGTSVPRGKKMTVYVSTGPARVKVPSVTEELLPQAEETLEEAGLHVSGKPTYRATSKAPQGTVIYQAPAAGKMVKKGSGVRLIVAKAPSKNSGNARSVTVPSVLGETEQQAVKVLERVGLTANPTPRTVKNAKFVGTVVDQQPRAGSSAKSGSTVTLYIGASSTSTTSTSTSTSTTSTTSTSTTSTSTTSTSTSTAPPGS